MCKPKASCDEPSTRSPVCARQECGALSALRLDGSLNQPHMTFACLRSQEVIAAQKHLVSTLTAAAQFDHTQSQMLPSQNASDHAMTWWHDEPVTLRRNEPPTTATEMTESIATATPSLTRRPVSIARALGRRDPCQDVDLTGCRYQR